MPDKSLDTDKDAGLPKIEKAKQCIPGIGADKRGSKSKSTEDLSLVHGKPGQVHTDDAGKSPNYCAKTNSSGNRFCQLSLFVIDSLKRMRYYPTAPQGCVRDLVFENLAISSSLRQSALFKAKAGEKIASTVYCTPKVRQ
jgi:hypothetical protein